MNTITKLNFWILVVCMTMVLNKSAKAQIVAEIPTTHNVSPGGAFEYSVPIQIPPGIKSLVSNLSINYSSSSGSGILGVGWTVSGLSAITRGMPTLHHNNDIKPIGFGSTDVLFLDGQRLLSIGSSLYQTEVKNFANIQAVGSAFIVSYPNGMTYEYGNTTNSRMLGQGKSDILTWAVNKVFDAHGNYITFEYTNNQSDGEYRISKITYGENSNTTTDIPVYINFNYTARSDANAGWIAGSKVASNVLLSNIIVNFSNNSEANRYTFTYDATNLSKLIKIEEKRNGTTLLPPIDITWGTAAQPISSDVINYSPLVYGLISITGDFNGDGYTDAIQKNGSTSYVYINDGAGNLSYVSGATAPYISNGFNSLRSTGSRSNRAIRFDYNGDGLDDVIAIDMYDKGYMYYDPLTMSSPAIVTVPKYEVWLYKANGNSTTIFDQRIRLYYNESVGVSSKNDNFNRLTHIQVGDFDGDGKSELFIAHPYNFNNPNSVADYEFIIVGEEYNNGHQIYHFGDGHIDGTQVFDYNGDGIDEFAVTHIYPSPSGARSLTYGLDVTYNTTTHQPILNQTPTHWPIKHYCTSPIPHTYAKNWFGDFNGDGLDDLLFWNTNSQVWTLIYSNAEFDTYLNSSGATTVVDYDPNWPLPSLSSTGPAGNDHSLHIGDFNGDGMEDILQLQKVSSTSTVYDIYYSKGLLNFSHETGSFIGRATYDNFLGDFNSDGQIDLLTKAFSGSNDLCVSFNKNSDELKVTSIQHAGKTLDIGYVCLTHDNDYQSASVPNSQYLGRPFPLKVVKTLSDGVDVSNTYKYTGLLYHKYGLGMRGLKTFEVENNVGQKTHSTFNLAVDFPYLSEEKVFDALGSAPYGTKTTYAQINENGGAGGKSRILYNYPQTISDFITGLETTTAISIGSKAPGTVFYDYGSIAATAVTKKDLNGNKQALSVTQNGYGTNWAANKGKPDSVRVYSDIDPVGNNSITRLTTFKYNALGDIDTLITDPATSNEKKTSFTYDLFGNVVKTELNAADPLVGPPLPNIIYQYEYTSDGKFKTKETDPELYFASYTYGALNANWGNAVSYTNKKGIVENYQYDATNRLIKTIHNGFFETNTSSAGNNPLETNTAFQWASSSSLAAGLANAHMVALTTTNDNGGITASVTDIYGREIRNVTTNMNGPVYKDVGYHTAGLIAASTSPYYPSSPSQKVTTTFSYDEYNREIYSSTDNGGADALTDYDISSGVLNTTTTNLTTGDSKTSTTCGDILLSINGATESINYTYHGNGAVATAVVNGETVEYAVDPFGRKISDKQPNSGISTVEYDALDRVVKETLGTGVEFQYKYDKVNRVREKQETGAPAAYVYTYHPVGTGQGLDGQLYREMSPNGYFTQYTYGSNGLLYSKMENNVRQFTTGYNYYPNGKIETYLFPRDISIKYTYNAYGEIYLSETINTTRVPTHKLWQFTSRNPYGQLTSAYLLNMAGAVIYPLGRSNDFHGLPTRRWVYNNTMGGSKIVDHTYSYNPANGNMLHRGDTLKGLTELFYYDAEHNRLTNVDYISPGLADLNLVYADNGNILRKTDVSTHPYSWKYNKYALEKVPDPAGSFPAFEIPSSTLDDEYYPFQKIKTIKEDTKNEIRFLYGPSDERIRAEYYNGTSGTTTPKHVRYYAENFELTVDNTTGQETEIYYAWADDELVGVFKVVVNTSTGAVLSSNIYYPVRDQLGSITHLLDDVGNGGPATNGIIEERSFDAWGRVRNPMNWMPYASSFPSSGTFPNWMVDRGYTGHEHLRFGTWNNNIINMNGRLYDPLIGRMFSPDPYIPDPGNSQDYNKYTYARNNPLKYTDPSGNIVWAPIIAGAVIGAYMGGSMANGGDLNPGSWNYNAKTFGWMAGGAIVGGVSGYVGGAISTSGIPMANTAGIAGGSLVNSIGTHIYTGGQTDVSMSFGIGSFNFSNGSFRGLWSSGLSTAEAVGYSLGAFANATDVTALVQGAYNSTTNLRMKTDAHTEFWDEDGNQVFSYGVNKPNGEPLLRGVEFKDRIPYAFKNLKENLTINYDNGSDGKFARWVTIKNVNQDKFNAYANSVVGSKNYYRFTSLLPFGIGKSMHCTIAGSRALFHGGVFNIPFLRMPPLLDLQMRMRDYAYMSFLLMQR